MYTHKILLEKYRKLIVAEVIIERVIDKLIEGDYEGMGKCIVRLVELGVLTEDCANEITKELSI